MRRGGWADLDGRQRLWDASEKGVLAVRRLVELGVPEGSVYRRCRPGGPWQLLLPAVVLLSTGRPTRDQMVVAGLVNAGEGGLVTGLEALRRHGVRRGPAVGDQVHLLVPHTRQPRSTRYVVVERTRRPPRPVRVDGVALAPAARAAVDSARRVRSDREITEMLADAVQRGLCSVADLVTEVAEAQRRGTAVPRRVLRAVRSGVRSAAEADAQRVWRRTGLPEPWWNARVFGPDGRLLGVADAWFDDVALSWEINSIEYHLAPDDYAREQRKTARFLAAGVPTLPTLPLRLSRDIAAVARELVCAYTHAARRPRPPVRALPAAR